MRLFNLCLHIIYYQAPSISTQPPPLRSAIFSLVEETTDDMFDTLNPYLQPDVYSHSSVTSIKPLLATPQYSNRTASVANQKPYSAASSGSQRAFGMILTCVY